jgi:hypothetical protein
VGTQHARAIIFLSGPTIETMIRYRLYVAEGGGLRAQKRCDSKPLLMAPQLRAHIASYPRVAHGHPLSIKSRCDPDKVVVNRRKEWWLKPQLTP